MAITNQVLQEGDVVISTQSEHASSVLPWLEAGEGKGVEVRYIPLSPEGRVTVENFRSVLDDKVKVVAIAQVSNVLGYEAPVKEIAKICREKGILTVIDGAQSVAHLPVSYTHLTLPTIA